MSKVLNYAGISRVAGELKFRTATEDSRFTQLTKLGDTDVEFIKIAPTDSKQSAAAELITRNFANGRADVEALLTAVAARTSAAKSPTVKVRNVKVKTAAKEPKLSIDQANALVLSTVREISPARALELCVHKMVKSRKRRVKETV